MPLRYSRRVVSNAVHELSPWISHLTCPPGYTPFTPSKSGQRLPPTYYRGCWHVVSRGLFVRYRLLLVPDKRSLQPESLLPSRGVAGSGFRPLPNIPHSKAGYSRVTHPSATKHSLSLSENSVRGAPFDLHVLSTPPAFIVSQDQTLNKMVSKELPFLKSSY